MGLGEFILLVTVGAVILIVIGIAKMLASALSNLKPKEIIDPSMISPKKRGIALLLTVFGKFGIHRLYIGDWKDCAGFLFVLAMGLGILWAGAPYQQKEDFLSVSFITGMFFLGLLTLVAFYDALRIALGSYIDHNGRVLKYWWKKPTTKKCPFCAEKIQKEAVKCKHCGEWLNKNND